MWTTFFLVVILMGESFGSNEKIVYKVTTGASSIKIPDVVLYSDVRNIIFSFPSLPKVKTQVGKSCVGFDFCEVINKNNEINRATFNLTNILTKMFTVSGQQRKEFPTNDWPKSLYSTTKSPINVEEDVDMRAVVEDFENQWHSHSESRKEHNTILSRDTRGVPIIPILRTFGPPLYSLMKNLFNSKKSIIRSITASNEIGGEPQLSIVPSLSEFALSSTFNSGDIEKLVKKVLNKFLVRNSQPESQYGPFFDMVDLSFFHTHLIIADIASLLYHAQVIAVHAQAVSSCRANEIPVSYIPPSMLYHKLLELEKQLYPDMELVIPPSNVMAYYKLDNADCTIGDDAGIVVVQIPIKPAQSTFELFKFHGLSFANQGMTCTFDLPSSYVVKETSSSSIYRITDADEDSCNPAASGKCLVPLINSGSTTADLCLQAIMRGESPGKLKSLCPSHCHAENHLRIFQPRLGTVIATNLPTSGVKSVCDEKIFTLNANVSIGAVQITLGCNCDLMIGTSKVAKSGGICVNGRKSPTQIAALIPVQWLKQNGPSVGAFVDNVKTVLDNAWHDQEFSVTDWLENQFEKISWIAALGQLCQALVTIGLYIRMNGIGAAIPLIMDRLHRANASSEEPICDLPLSTEVILHITLIVVLLHLVFVGIRQAFYKARQAWGNAVARAAVVRDIERQ